jgi:hypothetical protein
MATGLDVNSYAGKLTPWSNLLGSCAANCRIALVTLFCLSASSCGIYSADEITATVVDSDTSAPIEGANVVAAWIVRGGVNFGATVGYMKVMETVTDQNGKFHFQSWGPKPNFHVGEIRQEAPALILFKPGYRYMATGNQGSSLNAAPSAMTSDWNAKTIRMTRYARATPDAEGGYISLWTDLTFLHEHGYWSAIPRTLCAVGHEQEALSKRGIATALYSLKTLKADGFDCDFEGVRK